MSGQEIKLAKKRGRPATGAGMTVGVRLHSADLELVDRVASEFGVASGAALTRPMAIRMMILEFCKDRGYAHRTEASDDPEEAM